ncbi:50S ribosomal protein L27 [Candidatus Saccharibacteria bacterium RIFCSPHIGHO2_12_FULL_49_19]|nr:MAG: 50S ribosomal protein L27 [Candidatus Saccharibacteria bacterium RIFCSPHIGHO2_01_FULL_49_21]OGL36859.1 MAG: 50S ribosomal protein L27 [Candidatus Saccharibacteria bacterium RIFCSPHIGHO2_12_FULL_49_19]OGL37090.1 MAG: 50S ribosomal protein L27 [Candidatus Saccharibacteria bacterium RIFCSPLOWO2_01_FULL_49_22]
MSKIKAGGASKNVHDSPGQRLGIKVHGGGKVKAGDIIVRQVGMTKRPGPGTFMSKNYTIHAAREGIVKFTARKVKLFSGRSAPRTEVSVE